MGSHASCQTLARLVLTYLGDMGCRLGFIMSMGSKFKVDDHLPNEMAMEEAEEEYLLVELSGLPTPDMIKSCTGTCTLLGLESSKPILQLDNYMFQGVYEDSVGTAMVFKEDGRELKYLCKTDKKLVMKRVVLKNKQSSAVPPTPETAVPSATPQPAGPRPQAPETANQLAPALETVASHHSSS